MLLYEPPSSQADLHFRVLGIPVRVHPMFWLMTVILGVDPRNGTPPAQFVTWVAVVFVSILVHELGHALLQRRFNGTPWITLYGMGGLASCNDCDSRPRSQILISLAGPAAGFLFAILVAAALRLTGMGVGLQLGRSFNLGATGLESAFPLPLPLATLYWEPLSSDVANDLVRYLFYVNIIWGLVNLLPVYPLDGGHVSREVCTLRDPRGGIVISLWISLIVAGGMAVLSLLVWKSLLTGALFGYMAYSNYQTLQSYQGSAGRGW
jgi:stage IV sporulation protein FB